MPYLIERAQPSPQFFSFDTLAPRRRRGCSCGCGGGCSSRPGLFGYHVAPRGMGDLTPPDIGLPDISSISIPDFGGVPSLPAPIVPSFAGPSFPDLTSGAAPSPPDIPALSPAAPTAPAGSILSAVSALSNAAANSLRIANAPSGFAAPGYSAGSFLSGSTMGIGNGVLLAGGLVAIVGIAILRHRR